MHQYLTPNGDTYWVQMQTAPSPVAGAADSISDTAPVADRYNLSICEILSASPVGPQLWNISGAISPASSGSGTILTLAGLSGGTTTADQSGNFLFSGLADGAYTVTPSKAGYTFGPAQSARHAEWFKRYGRQLYSAACGTDLGDFRNPQPRSRRKRRKRKPQRSRNCRNHRGRLRQLCFYEFGERELQRLAHKHRLYVHSAESGRARQRRQSHRDQLYSSARGASERPVY